MKKLVLLLGLFTLAYTGKAQDKTVEIGLRGNMNIASNNADGQIGANNANNNGSGVRLGGGLTVDYFFTSNHNYAFSTGLWYTIRRSAFEATNPANGNVEGSSQYNLQYLQIPVTLKLYTSEVAPDTRIYFQLGGTADVKVGEKALNQSTNFLYTASKANDKSAYKPLGASLQLGAGVEFQVSDSNKLFAGLTYNRGLTNSVSGLSVDGSRLKDTLTSISSLIGIEVGIKF